MLVSKPVIVLPLIFVTAFSGPVCRRRPGFRRHGLAAYFHGAGLVYDPARPGIILFRPGPGSQCVIGANAVLLDCLHGFADLGAGRIQSVCD